MAVHTIMLPESLRGAELRSIVWDDSAGTVEGDHRDVPYIRRKLAAEKPVTVGDSHWTWDLRDPAHDPVDFLVLLYVMNPFVLDEPLRSALPPVFRGIEIPAPEPRSTLYINGEQPPGVQELDRREAA